MNTLPPVPATPGDALTSHGSNAPKGRATYFRFRAALVAMRFWQAVGGVALAGYRLNQARALNAKRILDLRAALAANCRR